MSGWLVARTQSNREAWAAENVIRQGGTPYLPRFLEARTKRGSYSMRTRYLFPSYIFVNTPDGRWRWLMGTFGIVTVVFGTGQEPARFPDKEIERLKSYEDADGLIKLPQLTGGVGRFKKGDGVLITTGPYAGYVGLYDGCGPKERERILLDFLGQKTKVFIEAGQLEAR